MIRLRFRRDVTFTISMLFTAIFQSVLTSLGSVVQQIPAIGRALETGLRTAGQVSAANRIAQGNQYAAAALQIYSVGLPALSTPIVQGAIQTISSAVGPYFSTSGTTSEADAAQARVSSAPSQQDLQATAQNQLTNTIIPSSGSQQVLQTASRPQLSTNSDAVPSTDPAVPIALEHASISSVNQVCPAFSFAEHLENLNAHLLKVQQTNREQATEFLEDVVMITDDLIDRTVRRLVPIYDDEDPLIYEFLKNVPLIQDQSWIGKIVP